MTEEDKRIVEGFTKKSLSYLSEALANAINMDDEEEAGWLREAICIKKGLNKTTLTKTQEAQPKGEYKETDIDRRKAEVDFCVIYTGTIRWKDGSTQQVTTRQLNKLCTEHTWATDY